MTFSTALLRDLYVHMEWADSEVWKRTLAAPGAQRQEELIAKLTHIHMTQRAFLTEWTGAPHGNYDRTFTQLSELYAWMRPLYGEIAAFLAALTDERLGRPQVLPWARHFAQRAAGRDPADTTLGETLFQLWAHTHYHRGQVNALLRAAGGEPPLVDYIGWLWLGRPPISWPSQE